MRPIRSYALALCLSALTLFSCKDKEELSTDQLSDYIPLQTGKYITYRLDSTVFLDFGTVPVVHSFHEKHVIDAVIPDALGRPSYRVFRYLRDTADLQPWSPAGSYFITTLKNTVEVTEDNLRVIKLALPIKQDYTWKGNRFLPDNPLKPRYGFQNDLDMEDWDYSYASMGESLDLNGQVVNDVLTVNGIDRSDNVPVTIPNSYGSIDYMQDKYAKGIGLVYQEWIMWDYQPPHENIPVPQKHGFGIKRSMIDHN